MLIIFCLLFDSSKDLENPIICFKIYISAKIRVLIINFG